MKSITFFILFLSAISFAQVKTDLKTPFEKGNGNQSTTYEECITYYKNANIKKKGIYDENGQLKNIEIFKEGLKQN